MSEQNKSFGQTLSDLFAKGNRNRFSIYRKGENKFSVTITAFIILLLILFPAGLILMLLGLFFGCKYRFSGPDFPENNQLNHMFDQLSEISNQSDEK